MTVKDFSYRENFQELSDTEITHAIGEVSVMFSGVLQLWGVLEGPLREKKRSQCLNLLLGWYLLDLYPASSSDVMGNGGMSLQSKSIGGTSLSFSDMDAQEGLKQLNSNVFGQKALIMIQSAPERYGIYA